MVCGLHYSCYRIQRVMLGIDYNIEIQRIGRVDVIESRIPFFLTLKSAIYTLVHLFNGARILARSSFISQVIKDTCGGSGWIEQEKHLERRRHPMPGHTRINHELIVCAIQLLK